LYLHNGGIKAKSMGRTNIVFTFKYILLIHFKRCNGKYTLYFISSKKKELIFSKHSIGLWKLITVLEP
jgi:hypothetical protein